MNLLSLHNGVLLIPTFFHITFFFSPQHSPSLPPPKEVKTAWMASTLNKNNQGKKIRIFILCGNLCIEPVIFLFFLCVTWFFCTDTHSAYAACFAFYFYFFRCVDPHRFIYLIPFFFPLCPRTFCFFFSRVQNNNKKTFKKHTHLTGVSFSIILHQVFIMSITYDSFLRATHFFLFSPPPITHILCDLKKKKGKKMVQKNTALSQFIFYVFKKKNSKKKHTTDTDPRETTTVRTAFAWQLH